MVVWSAPPRSSSQPRIRPASASAWVVIDEKWVPGVAYTSIVFNNVLPSRRELADGASSAHLLAQNMATRPR